MALTDSDIDDMARELGWIDYPHDSLEQGQWWHCEPNKAPFGIRRTKCDFRREVRKAELLPSIVKERLFGAKSRENQPCY